MLRFFGYQNFPSRFVSVILLTNLLTLAGPSLFETGLAGTEAATVTKPGRDATVKVAKVLLDGCVKYEAASSGEGTPSGRSMDELIKSRIAGATLELAALRQYQADVATIRPANTKQATAVGHLLVHMDNYLAGLKKYKAVFESKVVARLRPAATALSNIRADGDSVRTELSGSGLWACGPLFSFG